MFAVVRKTLIYIVCMVLFMLVLFLAAVVAQSEVVLQNDFEKGTDKWEPRGPASISTAKDQAATGAKSMRVSNRSEFWQGAQLNVTKLIQPGKSYRFTASVKLAKGEKPDDLKMTMQRGDNKYDTVAMSNVSTDEWVTLTGKFKPPGGDPYMLIYFEAIRPNTSFYVDDFKIESLGDDIPAQSGTILQNDFEDMTAQNWFVLGDNVQMFSSNAAGSQSIKVAGRTQSWHGLALDVSPIIFKGRTYEISVSVRLVKGQAPDKLKVTVKQTPPKGEAKYVEVTKSAEVTDAGWVTLTGQYTGTTNDNNLVLYVEAAGATTSFFIDNFSIKIPGTSASSEPTRPMAERDIPALYKSLAEYFPVGVAIWKGDLEGEHAFLVARHFNSITSENDMKFASVQPTEGKFTFEAADAEVKFAKANGMKIRGHALVWHEQFPEWLFKDASGKPMTPTPDNKALLLKRLETHIRTVVGHFGDSVYAWDVVNEVIDPTQEDGFRRSEWFNITGLDYIRIAFRIAREVAPNAKLYINDYETMNPKKRKLLYDLIASLLKEGIPIDGVGHQMHENIEFPSKETVIETINLFNGLKIDNQITELDISVYSGPNSSPYSDYQSIDRKSLIKQGYRYRELFDAFRSLKGKITGVTFWSHSDDHTWLSKPNRIDAPLLFDRSLKSKYAYWGIIDPSKLPTIPN